MDRRRLLIIPYILWLFGLVAAPFLLIVMASFGHRDENGGIQYGLHWESYATLFDPLYLEVFGRTLLMATIHSVLTLAAAYPAAFFLSRLDRTKAAFYLTMLLVPFWTNYLIRLLAFMDVLRLHPFGLEWTFTFRGIVAALLYNYLPFAVLPLYSALEKVPTSLIEAAQDLGASKRQVLFQVLWPMTRKPVTATFLLVFIPALGEFLIPELVGGGQNFFLGTFLQQQFLTTRNWPLGSAAIALLILLASIMLMFGGKALAEDA
ncbi:MAG: ABC transporter permease [Bdellovibrionota bacterium]